MNNNKYNLGKAFSAARKKIQSKPIDKFEATIINKTFGNVRYTYPEELENPYNVFRSNREWLNQPCSFHEYYKALPDDLKMFVTVTNPSNYKDL
jgi:hypothetical protein